MVIELSFSFYISIIAEFLTKTKNGLLTIMQSVDCIIHIYYNSYQRVLTENMFFCIRFDSLSGDYLMHLKLKLIIMRLLTFSVVFTKIFILPNCLLPYLICFLILLINIIEYEVGRAEIFVINLYPKKLMKSTV